MTVFAAMRGHQAGRIAAALVSICMADAVRAQAVDVPQLQTNQSYVEEITRATTLSIGEPLAVFAFVLNSLPDRVKVYPTENYYYFRFTHNGTPYAGNIALDPAERDQGKLRFGYYKDQTEWRKAEGDIFLHLDASQGVKVERIDRLVYRVSHGGKSVVFALNDLSAVQAPASVVGPDDKFLGTVFDESAVRFFLLFNTKLKIFHYVLDETVKPTEEYFAAAGADRILIGRRTGFAFYRDHRLDRKILVGVFESNSRLNNYFDGPFDQLPENFIEGEALRDAIVASDPEMKGRIDRLGNYHDGSGRYVIHPYRLYRKDSDLLVFHRCATDRRVPQADYHRCFVVDDEEQDRANPLPAALKALTKPARAPAGTQRRQRSTR
jgi:hypothetical protein